jgi:hypothetical protein
LELLGLPDAALLVPVPEDAQWPRVRVAWREAPPDPADPRIDEAGASIALEDGTQVLVDRGEGTATLVSPRSFDDGSLVHPFLAAAGTLFAWWLGREALHGGAFATPEGAWCLLGERGTGKSSLLASLAARGQPVLTDDLIVVDGPLAMAGPRCIDLRGPSVERLGITEAAPVRGDRHRLELAPVAPQTQVLGWVFLAWGDELSLRALAPGERLVRLSAQRNVQGVEPRRLLELSGLPGWELVRPKGWESFEPAVDGLLDVATG